MYNEIPLFKAERDAGLTSQDLAKASISYIVPLEEDKEFKQESIDSKFKDFAKTVASENIDITLFPIKDILVSTVWNSNDDVFDPQEVWAAKYTPINKPFNYEHNCDDIIGHTIASVAVGEDGKELSGDLTLDDLPFKYHLISKSLIYRHWSKADLQKRIDKIIEEIPQGLWFVSVECLFPKFDYALRDDKGNFKIVARNNETAFLTKTLRCYGGKGIYQDHQIGRLPRNLIFSGKGLVKKPANPESIILAKKYDLILENKNVGYNISLNNTKEVKSKMDEKELQKQIDALKTENAQLVASIKENDVKGYKTQVEKLSKDLSEVTAKQVSDAALLKTATEELKASQDKFAEVDKARKELQEKFDKIQAENKVTERYSLVVSKLKLDEVKAKKLVANLSVLDDKAFAEHVDMQAELLSASQVTKTEVEKKNDEKTAQVNKDALENVEKNKTEASLNVQNQDNGVEKVRAQVCDFLTASLADNDNVDEK